MSSNTSDRNSVSKVTFTPITDAAGKTELLVVNIRPVTESSQDYHPSKHSYIYSPETLPDRREKFKMNYLRDNKNEGKLSVKENVDHGRKEDIEFGTISSDPLGAATKKPTEVHKFKNDIPGSSANIQALNELKENKFKDTTPCIQHAAKNISRKAIDLKSEKLSLCNNCSKSMLSYIFVVQDFLDSLAREIGNDSESSRCLQCLREENRLAVDPESTNQETSDKAEKINSRIPPASKISKLDSKKYKESSEMYIQRSITHQQNVFETRESSTKTAQSTDATHKPHKISNTLAQQLFTKSHDDVGYHGIFHKHKAHYVGHNIPGSDDKPIGSVDHSRFDEDHHFSGVECTRTEDGIQSQSARHQDDVTYRRQLLQHRSTKDVGDIPSLSSEEVDGIVSTLSNAEREVYDSARNGAGWEGLSEAQERLLRSPSEDASSQAFVTMCRNNSEALGCLVVGTSLLLRRTTRQLCVLVSDGVSTAFKDPLSSVFHFVIWERSLDTLGSTKLALLEQPELGVSFERLNVWRLTQFTKCVFLGSDTLVLSNCDELFDRPELSAVPDVGWPDCFNNGVFVFCPSQTTFWQLLDFAERQGSYDGGDQGLLNCYFNSWSENINSKLSFIYNLMANVSYTYTPAFKQFGRDVKIVQFQGTFKPWHVKFYSRTGQIAPSSTVHPTYIQFVHIWINIFRISSLKELSQEIQSYALSQEVISAIEVLRFFPLPSESEKEFFLTPPSVRLRLTEKKLQTPTRRRSAEVQRRKSAEFYYETDSLDKDISPIDRGEAKASSEVEDSRHDDKNTDDPLEVDDKQGDGNGKAQKVLPGAEVGNYLGMKAWEQGRMDYQGTDSSENIIRRLEFLMSHSNS